MLTFQHLERFKGEVVPISITVTDKKVNIFYEFAIEINTPPVDEEV